jgi:hypothetical protein
MNAAYVFVAALLLSSPLAVAAECRFENPTHLGLEALLIDPQVPKGAIELRDLKLDPAPKTLAPYLGQPSDQPLPLALELFAVRIGDKVSKFLGANLNPIETTPGYHMSGAGIPAFTIFPKYIQSTAEKHEQTLRIRTEDLGRASDDIFRKPRPDGKKPKTVLEVDFVNDEITRIELTLPVDTVFRGQGGYRRLEYTGVDEVICVRSGRLYRDNTPI